MLFVFFFFFSRLSDSEGFLSSRAAPAGRHREVVGLHHLPVRGVRHHEEQLRGALPGPGVSHLHLPAGGRYPGLLFSPVPMFRGDGSWRISAHPSVSCFCPSLDSRHRMMVWLVVQPVRMPLVPGSRVNPGSVPISCSYKYSIGDRRAAADTTQSLLTTDGMLKGEASE